MFKKKELTKEQIEKAKKEARLAYEQAYDALCEEHGYKLIPRTIITPGQYPYAELIAVEI